MYTNVFCLKHKFGYNGCEHTDESTKKENRKKVITRTRNNVRRLAITNFNENSSFFTATSADNITDMDYTNNEF
jgi:hypothetical protein